MRISITILCLVVLLLSSVLVREEKKIYALEGQMSMVSDFLVVQLKVNKAVIETLHLSNDPDYLKSVTTTKIAKFRKKKSAPPKPVENVNTE